MPSITFTFTAAHGTIIGDAFDRIYPGRPEEVTKADWWKKQVVEMTKNVVRADRQRAAQIEAQTEVDNAEPIIVD